MTKFYAAFQPESDWDFEDIDDTISPALRAVCQSTGCLEEVRKAPSYARYEYQILGREVFEISINSSGLLAIYTSPDSVVSLEMVLGVVFTLESVGECISLKVWGDANKYYLQTHDLSPKIMSEGLKMSEVEYLKLWEESVLPVIEELGDDSGI